MELAEAVVAEILSEMRAKGISSLNEMGRQAGWAQQYVHFRLGTGNPKTGERVILTIADIEDVAVALHTKASLIVARAEVIAALENAPATPPK